MTQIYWKDKCRKRGRQRHRNKEVDRQRGRGTGTQMDRQALKQGVREKQRDRGKAG